MRGRVGVTAYSSQKSPSVEGPRGQSPRPRHHRAEASWPIDQVRFSGTVRHTYGAWGAMGELQMNSKLTKLAAAGVLSLCTAAPGTRSTPPSSCTACCVEVG